MSCPKVIRVVTPGPPGPPGGGITLSGPAVLGREDPAVGVPVALPLGAGLMITAGALAVREVSAAAAGLVPAGWVSGATAATLPHIHGNLAGIVYEHIRPVGAPLSALMPYHVVGSQGDTDRVQVVAADAGDPQTMPASGILPLALAQNADGHGAVVGPVTGVNTAAYAPGTALYVAVGGGLTATMPAANVQQVAVVGRSHATTGTIVPLIGPSLSRAAYTGAYADLLGPPAIPATPADIGAATAAQGAKADSAVQPGALTSYVQTTDARLSDVREWSAATVDQAEAEAGASTTRRAWTAQRVRQAAAAWWATVASGYVQTTDSRLSDVREWSAATVDQSEAEAGVATTRRAWTALRVRQATAAWWLTASTAAGRTLASAADVAAQRTALGIPAAVATPTGVMITAANIVTLTGGSATSNRIQYMKIRIDATSSPTQILCRTNTTYVGTSVVQLGIYSSVGNRAQDRIYTSGNVTIDVPTATASANYGAAVSGVTLAPGWYWLAVCFASVGTTPSFLGGGNNTNGVGFPYSAEFTTAGASMSHLLEVASSLPAVANGTPNGGAFSAVFLVF